MHWPRLRLCEAERIRPISLADVQGVFYTFAIGLIISVLFFVGEHLHRAIIKPCGAEKVGKTPASND